MQKASDADIQAVLRKRAQRLPPRPAVLSSPGSHVWAASGLVGWPGSSPTNVFAQSGLVDPLASLKEGQRNATDWVTTVANAINSGKR